MPNRRDISALLRSLADPTRRALFERLTSSNEATVTTLVRRSEVSQPAVSQHLRALGEAGLVAKRRAGKHVFYRAEPRALAPLVNWLEHYTSSGTTV